MTEEDWSQDRNRAIAMWIPGEAADEIDERGRSEQGQTLFLALNASNRAQHFVLPRLPDSQSWRELVNTSQAVRRTPKGAGVNVAPHSLVLLAYEG